MSAPLPLPRGNWNYPTSVRFGAGRIAELPQACAELGLRRPLLVTDRGLADLPVTVRVRAILADAGLPDAFFGGVSGNPAAADVEAGLAAYRAHGCDGVVGFGGGSALDVAKAVGLMVGQTRPLFDFEDRDDWTGRVDPDGMVPVVAVPTTAGTGSEVGRASVILDEDARVKKIIFHPKMLPGKVISDPELTVGLPPHITAWTGIDALSHLLEAYCAPGFHPMADGVALEGMRLIAGSLPRAFADGADLRARGDVLAAASMGAMAFQKGLGGMHALAHPIGALHHTHHGLTNSVLMPYVLHHNRSALGERMARLARLLDLEGAREDGFGAALAWVLRLRTELQIPHTLDQIGVKDPDIGLLSQMAAEDPSAGGNPLPFGAAEARAVLEAALSGASLG